MSEAAADDSPVVLPMLFLLDYAARDDFRIEIYRDDAVGVMGLARTRHSTR